jgi:hypothetical protein
MKSWLAGVLMSLTTTLLTPLLTFPLPILFWGTAHAAAPQTSSLLGRWLFTSYIYRGHEYQKRLPKLELYYQFSSSGISSMSWRHSENQEYCSRLATFSNTATVITEEIFWLDPKNDPSCSQDSDMQMGKNTRVAYAFDDGRLIINVGLSGEPLYYVYSKVE